jgi:hypothetical protein
MENLYYFSMRLVVIGNALENNVAILFTCLSFSYGIPCPLSIAGKKLVSLEIRL